MAIVDLIYPAVVLLSIALAEVLGIETRQSFMLTTVVLVLSFVVTVPVVIRRIQGVPDLVVIGSLSVLLLLPVNQVTQAGVFLQPYPTTAALFFLPVLLFFFVAFVEEHSNSHLIVLV
ncbi:MAG: hypothetical protein R6U42_09175, partial [Halomonas sp.]